MSGPRPKAYERCVEAALNTDHDQCILVHQQPWYKTVCRNGVHRGAHNWVARIAHGDPPPDKPQACHTCHDRRCINPRHIYWGDAKDNAADYAATPEFNDKARRARKLSDDDVRAIRSTPRYYGVCLDLAEQHGVSVSYVRHLRGNPGSRTPQVM